MVPPRPFPPTRVLAHKNTNSVSPASRPQSVRRSSIQDVRMPYGSSYANTESALAPEPPFLEFTNQTQNTSVPTTTDNNQASVAVSANSSARSLFDGYFNQAQDRKDCRTYSSKLKAKRPAVTQASENLQAALNIRNTRPLIPALVLPFRPSPAGPSGIQRGSVPTQPVSMTIIKGLRKTLHAHGQSGNVSKTELKDITFYNHTLQEQQINPRTAHTNQFVVNYAGEDMTVGGKTVDVGRGGSGVGQRCVMYQLDMLVFPREPSFKSKPC